MHKIIATIGLLATLLSCGSVNSVLNDHTLLTGVAAYKATAELIERADDSQERAQRVLTYTETALRLINDDDSVTLNALHEAIYVLIDWDSIPPVDRPLIEDLIAAIKAEIAANIDTTVSLTPETRVTLTHIIDRIRMAAEFYA